ncbi:hypothetical protein CANARDRAFT_173954 [[Candida] arabinofermentans NRRL YB-2248]|uniref:Transmembrane 9 superfamily member n=1 Tax=[Candida] arabinofermentans NRRL YB-2248 TaxID=983967 RepID=A0A1E4T8L9_9ASCO|nr:hypothetical protein CANARDRAFT_173954 [[Candida] arabinofermentans NRRL YB-2248]
MMVYGVRANLPWEKKYYKSGEKVELLVNTVESEKSQHPYAYYHLPFVCPPTGQSRPVHLSLGEVLKGDRFWQSDYQLIFEKDEPCRRLCDRIISPQGIKVADDLIKNDYMIEWTIDGLPGSTTFIKPKNNKENHKKYYVAGFPLGFNDENGNSYLHNHVMMVIRWHKESGDPNKKTIVGFEVYPKSVSDYHCPGASKNFANLMLNPNSNERQLASFTYSIYWREDIDVNYDNRWDMYQSSTNSNDGTMHWISIINSLVLVSLLSLSVGIVFLRTLNIDFKSSEFISNEFNNLVIENPSKLNNGGWRSINNEVFIQPSFPLFLSIFGGAGIQLSITMFGLSILCTSGISGPGTTIISTTIGIFVTAGFFAGFAGVEFYKIFSYDHKYSWKRVAFLSASLLTGFVLLILLIINTIVWAKDNSLSPRTIPFGTIIALISIYVLLEIPLGLIGGLISNKTNLINKILPLRSSTTSSIKSLRKSVPNQPFYNKLRYSLPILGLIPFGIIFVEMLFLFKTLYVEKLSFYRMYGFLSFTAFLLFIVILEISIISTYLRLNSGDYYNWQWKSFISSFGGIFLYLVIYTIYYLFTKVKLIDFLSALLYVVYSLLMNFLISVACGAIGLLSSTIFVYKIYSSIKKD